MGATGRAEMGEDMCEDEFGKGADQRHVAARAVLFTMASIAAWWCWSGLASADETPLAPPAAAPAAELFPVVVAPLVEAVAPAVEPAGAAVLPMVDAVTTPAAPMLESVAPTADRFVGPAVAPAAAPAVGAVTPVVAQFAGAMTPAGQLLAPVAPLTQPVAGAVAPAVGQVVSGLAQPVPGVASVTQQATRTVLEPDAASRGLQPAATVVPLAGPVDGGADATRGVTAEAPVLPPSATLVRATPATGRHASLSTTDDREAGDPAAFTVLAPASADADLPRSVPAGVPSRSTLPPAGAVAAGQGTSEPGQRSSHQLAALPAASGATAVPTGAQGGIPAVSPLATFGGRPQVTPD